MKATLHFDLPEEQEEMRLALKGVDYKIALEDMDNYLRHKLKYEELTSEQSKIYEEVRRKFHEITSELDIW